ncbi:hypothetical protein Tco_0373996, partial [Tanacetum coccineum]
TNNDVKNFWSSHQKRLARVLQTLTTSPAPWSKKCVSGSPALHKVPVFEATTSDSPTFLNCNDHFSPYEEECAIDQGDQEPDVPGVALQDSEGHRPPNLKHKSAPGCSGLGALIIQLLDAILEKIVKRSYNCIARPLVSLIGKLIGHIRSLLIEYLRRQNNI